MDMSSASCRDPKLHHILNNHKPSFDAIGMAEVESLDLATLTLQPFLAEVLQHVCRFSVDQWTVAVTTVGGLGLAKPEYDAVPFRAWQHMLTRIKNSKTGDRLPPHLRELR
eukprot:155254-Amphidinium_carterae.1